MKRLHALILISALAANGVAVAHPKVTATEPAVGAQLDTAPKMVQVTFNEKIEPSFSTMTLAKADGTAITTTPAKVDAAAPMTLVLQAPALAAGDYVAHYGVSGHDGHRREGDLKFSVK